MKYVIYDWAGNLMPFGEFEHFDDACGFLAEKFDHLSENEFEEEIGEFYVEEAAV